jgi:hypothetical protein
MKKHVSLELRVSVDIGCRSHNVAIGLSSGEVLDEFSITHEPEGFRQFFSRIEKQKRRFGCPVAVAMEGYNGYARPLDTLVRARKGLELFQICDHLPMAKDVLQEEHKTPQENEILKRLLRRLAIWLMSGCGF